MKPDNQTHYRTVVSIATAFQVHRNTVREWMKQDWWPAPAPGGGWDKAEVQIAIEEYETRRDEVGDPADFPAGTKEEKTALECKRLKIIIEKEKELLEQAKAETRRINIETDVRAKQLIEKKEVLAGLTATTAKARSVIESWAKTCTAEDPANHAKYQRAVETYLKIANAELPSIT